MTICYLNGEFLPVEQAQVSVLDRGFLFGDGVYEVIPVYGGQLFRLPQHLRRLDYSLASIHLANPLTAADWQALLAKLIERNGGGDLSVYLQVTRGPAPRDLAFPVGSEPTVFAYAAPLAPATDDAGLTAITLEDIRWRYCHIKAITLLPNAMLRQQAIDQGADEAILVRDGEVTEGTASNVFVVYDSVVVTPPKGPFLLPGITRDVILELAQTHGLDSRERPVQVNDLSQAEEIWVSSSTRELRPVVQLDGQAVGHGQPGPLWHQLQHLYSEYKQAVREGRTD